jgi:hypothetical protein
MKTPKLLKGITGKFRNQKGRQIAATAAETEEPRTSNVPEDVGIKGQEKITNTDKATETGTQLRENINNNGDDLNIYINLHVKPVKEFKTPK